VAIKLKSFKELVSMTKEKLDEALLPLRIDAGRNKAQGAVITLKEKLITIETQLNEQCSQKELNFDKLTGLMDEYDLTERQLKQIEALVSALFPQE